MMERKTILSPDRQYRYTLWRVSPSNLFEMSIGNWTPYVNFILLNPSTADETNDDPTIRRCIGFAKEWGYGAVCITNLFAYRATEPNAMKSAADPIGPENDKWLIGCAKGAELSVAGWGTHGGFLSRAEHVLKIVPGVVCLGKTKDGHPRHPLYLPKTAKPQNYNLTM